MNDIKTLPFEDLYTNFVANSAAEINSTLAGVIAVKKRQHKEAIARIVASAGVYDTEAGSDGVEEAAIETYGEFNEDSIELKYETIVEIKDKCLTAAHKEFCETHNISNGLGWIAPQILAYFGSWNPVMGENGKFNAKATLRKNAISNWDIGAVFFATGPRPHIFAKNKRDTPQYASPLAPLVPIILAGLKIYKDIPFSMWDKEGLEKIVDISLYKAMVCTIPELTKTELITLRNKAITNATGVRANIAKNPATCATLNHLTDTALGSVPKLARVMALQTWCAHPNNRKATMILDPSNWDSFPEVLIDTNVAAKWSADTTGCPWD